MEGLPCEGFRNVARILRVATDDHDTRVVVLHRQPPVILGLAYLAGVFPWKHEIPRDIPAIPSASISHTPPKARQTGIPSW